MDDLIDVQELNATLRKILSVQIEDLEWLRRVISVGRPDLRCLCMSYRCPLEIPIPRHDYNYIVNACSLFPVSHYCTGEIDKDFYRIWRGPGYDIYGVNFDESPVRIVDLDVQPC
jgi:hypothetical protein